MTIQTERLLLRPWQASDAEDLYAYASDPRVGPAAGWPPHTSVDNSRDIIRDVLSASETYAIVDKRTGRAIGSIGLMVGAASHIGLPDTQGELGYWIGVPYWGQGLVPEAVQAMLRHAFEELGLTKVWCGYYDGNDRSLRVQQKGGFAHRYTLTAVPCTLLGETRTEHITCLTQAAWSGAPLPHKVCGSKEPVAYLGREGAYLIPVQDGQVGVVKTPRGYFLLGGGLEKGEAHAACIVRECLEETGYACIVKDRLCTAESYGKHPALGYFHPIQTYYTGTLLSQVAIPAEKSHRFEWVDAEELRGHLSAPIQNWALEQALEG
jgi:RimJ/RimL family protein N-acetyltransferase/ADP-ribose pyrophosphatase YjhB (NUDIX family)